MDDVRAKTEQSLSVFPRSSTWLGAFAVVVPTMLYFSLFWNRFLGIRSGDGEYAGGAAFLAGLLPYRDYFIATTPLNILKSAAILATFGDTLIALRIAAVVERILIALLLFFWLRRLFKLHHAILGAVATIILSTADLSDPICSYNHDAIFLAMISGFVASFATDEGRKLRAFALLSITAGIFAALSFATKQTIGLGATVITPFVVAVVLLRLDGWKKSSQWIGFFFLGWTIPAGILLLWLAHLGMIRIFIEMVFIKGPAAKAGHPSDFLLRALLILGSTLLEATIGLVVLMFTWKALNRSEFSDNQDERIRDLSQPALRSVFKVLVMTVISILVGAILCWANYSGFALKLSRSTLWSVYFTECGLCVILVRCAFRCLTGKLTRRQGQLAILAAVSFAVALMLSLSYPVFEAMLIPGLGLLIGAALDGMQPGQGIWIYAALSFVIVAETSAKMALPFYFGFSGEPSVLSANSISELPQLHGLLLPRSTVEFVDDTVKIIRTHSTPLDTIFTYPEMTIFYSLSGRTYPTIAGSHNIDVVNDHFAQDEAKKLLLARPKVIIYRRLSEGDLRLEEFVWRHGNQSGQRDIISAIETLLKDYKLTATYGQVQVYVSR